ncbi:hypothetical protein JCM8547_003309 [Rhodosporidiobolus lusitaniae]
MSTYTEASLKGLTVPKLKDILAAHSLPVTGKKDDLIQRILSSPGLSPSTPSTTDTTGPASATDEPDGLGETGLAEVSAAANLTTEQGAEEVGEGLKSKDAEEAEVDQQGGGEDAAKAAEEAAKKVEEAKKAREQEEERRRKRAERFGQVPGEEEAAKKARAEKYGLQIEEGANGLEKSLAALDRPLGQKRQREPKPSKPASASAIDPASKSSNPANGGGVVNAAASKKGGVSAAEASAEPAAAVAADPELRAKLEAEEEKKRKRLERFGGGAAPAEKKAKLDEPAAATA